jgi:hypothetical protein
MLKAASGVSARTRARVIRCHHPLLVRSVRDWRERDSIRAGVLHQIPEVSVQVLEDGNRTVVSHRWLSDELDLTLNHVAVITPEVVGAEEERDSPTCLIPDERVLPRVRRTRQQQAGARRSGRSHKHPALILLRDVCILDKRKVQFSSEERDCLIVISNDEGHVGDRLSHRSIVQRSRTGR